LTNDFPIFAKQKDDCLERAIVRIQSLQMRRKGTGEGDRRQVKCLWHTSITCRILRSGGNKPLKNRAESEGGPGLQYGLPLCGLSDIMSVLCCFLWIFSLEIIGNNMIYILK
jgi:hypothetical protein